MPTGGAQTMGEGKGGWHPMSTTENLSYQSELPAASYQRSGALALVSETRVSARLARYPRNAVRYPWNRRCADDA